MLPPWDQHPAPTPAPPHTLHGQSPACLSPLCPVHMQPPLSCKELRGRRGNIYIFTAAQVVLRPAELKHHCSRQPAREMIFQSHLFRRVKGTGEPLCKYVAIQGHSSRRECGPGEECSSRSGVRRSLCTGPAPARPDQQKVSAATSEGAGPRRVTGSRPQARGQSLEGPPALLRGSQS